MQIIRLGDFTAERQLNAAIQQWSRSVNDLLIIQSDTVFDKDHLPLAKVHVERARADLLAQAQFKSRHVIFILHSHRGEQQSASPFSFLSGWKQITLDQLHHEDIDYRYLPPKGTMFVFVLQYLHCSKLSRQLDIPFIRKLEDEVSKVVHTK